jgi:di/tricarboxylate transporter
MIAGGCVRLDGIYRIISWKTVVLIAGMLPLATALTKTGATDLMAKELVATLGSLGPIAMLAWCFWSLRWSGYLFRTRRLRF